MSLLTRAPSGPVEQYRQPASIMRHAAQAAERHAAQAAERPNRQRQSGFLRVVNLPVSHDVVGSRALPPACGDAPIPSARCIRTGITSLQRSHAAV